MLMAGRHPEEAMTEGINGDLEERVILRTARMAWQPWRRQPGVDFKPLDRIGPEANGRVTAILRIAPGVTLEPHDHPGGEEILVLDGGFGDETGTYGTGTYVFNPDGSRHTAWSKDGCVMFLKLRQHPGAERKRVVVDTTKMDWLYQGHVGRAVKKLNVGPGYPEIEDIRFTRLDKGIRIPLHGHPGGNEMFVLEGSIEDEYGRFDVGDWIRQPAASRHAPWTDDGCVLFVRDGHIRPRDGAAPSLAPHSR
jgi:anti-sigma factor ChrR (cupin superfamily)